MARQIIGEDRFVEVYVATPMAICEQRDIKGFYQRARSGEIADFTGVSAPYELPENPMVTIDTSLTTLDGALAQLAQVLMPRLRVNSLAQ